MVKYLKLVCVYMVTVIAGIMLLGCNAVTVTKETNIAEQLAGINTYMNENVYSKPAGTDFNTDTSPNYIQDSNYYVKVASKVPDTGDKIKLGNTVYDKGKEFVLDVGNSNKVSRPPFKVSEENLFISFWLIVLNANEDGEVKVSFPTANIREFMIDVYAQSENNLTANVKNVGDAELSNLEIRQYEFKTSKHTNAIFVELYNGETNLTASNKVIIEKVLNPGESTQDFMYEFTNPTIPAGQTKYGLLLYPGYNNNKPYEPGNPADFVLEYKIYVNNVGTYVFKLYVKNTAQ